MEGVHIRCNGCKRTPEEISEYVDMAEELNTTPARFVQTDEGTYNATNGHFWCSACYIRAGLPLGTAP